MGIVNVSEAARTRSSIDNYVSEILSRWYPRVLIVNIMNDLSKARAPSSIHVTFRGRIFFARFRPSAVHLERSQLTLNKPRSMRFMRSDDN